MSDWHDLRKRAVRWTERHVLPSVDKAAVSELLYRQTRDKTWRGQVDLPTYVLGVYRTWAAYPDEACVRLYKGPLTVDPKIGMLFSRGRAIWGSSDARMGVRERSPHFHRHWLGAPRRFEALISLRGAFETNYFHYLNDVLTRLRLVELLDLPKGVPVLVSQRLAACRFFADTVQRGFFDGREIVVQGKDEVIAAQAIYAISDFDCNVDSYDWLCERLGVAQDGSAGKAVYVHRGANAPNARRLSNEAQAFELMRRHGVEVIDPAALSLDEQIATFARAGLVIGPHGAGLVNLIFRRCNSSLLELFNPGFGTPHYHLIARQRGAYHWLNNRAHDAQDYRSPSEMDIEAVAAFLAHTI